MNVLIVEDEPPAANRLKTLLEIVDSTVNVLAVTASIRETVDWLNSHDEPDLILMDIHLSDGNCFSIFEICQISAPIVFCTAYDEYALEAFQANGIAYLLKPATEDDLRQALGRLEQLRQVLTRGEMLERRRVLRRFGSNQDGYKSRFLIKAGDKLIPVATNDIACFLAEANGVKAYFFNGDSYFIEYTLAELIEVLDPADFFQISRQAIIAGRSVTSTSAHLRKATVYLEAVDRNLPIARDRAKPFRQWFAQ